MSGCVRGDLEYLASDATDGRDNATAGSVRAQDYILGYLTTLTMGANSASTGNDAYKQVFTGGTNIVGMIPGTDLADQYVVIGAHYDHLGHACRDLRAGDDICNGATDNAAGVAAVLQLVRAFGYAPQHPRRTIVFAFWDREEDGLRGSMFYAQNPLVPLAQTVAYVNLDIQGANLRPSLRNLSFAVGAETGGARLQQIVQSAIDPGTLDTRELSSVFGQGRSDYVNFIGAGDSDRVLLRRDRPLLPHRLRRHRGGRLRQARPADRASCGAWCTRWLRRACCPRSSAVHRSRPTPTRSCSATPSTRCKPTSPRSRPPMPRSS